MPARETVLVLSDRDDPTADAVIACLDRRPVTVVRADVGDFPLRLRLGAVNRSGRWQGRLSGDIGAPVDLEEIRSIYYRRPTGFRLPAGLSDGDASFAVVEARLGFGGVLAALDAYWVNDPARIAVAEYKPLQLRRAADSGFTVPRTLITNDHHSVTDFAAEVGGAVVCKTLSSLVLSEEGMPHITFTTPVDPAGVDPRQVSVTAHLFQEWIPKSYEVRLTMAGQVAIGVAIRAGSDRGLVDWRSDYAGLSYRRIDVPMAVTTAARRYLDAFGLAFGAFDFVVTPEDEWVMLECNPAGQWLWLEEETGAPIAAALAGLLVGDE